VKAVHSVRSLSADVPDYVVAEIAGPHGTKGLALFLAKGDDYAFGGLTLDEAYLHILPPVQAIHAAGGNPSSASAELVWGWSAASGSPFYPLYAVDSPAGMQYVDMSGDVVDSLELR
jgi:hypothetical protein